KAQGFGGRVEDRSPNGVVVVFGLEPIEDGPRRAARAAMAIQKGAERAQDDQAEPLGIRFAIHVGQFLVGQGSGASQIDLDGKLRAWAAVDDRARDAEPGAIVVSDGAAAFRGRAFALTAIPAEPGRAPRFRLAGGEWPALGPRRRMAAFVGRGHELEL